MIKLGIFQLRTFEQVRTHHSYGSDEVALSRNYFSFLALQDNNILYFNTVICILYSVFPDFSSSCVCTLHVIADSFLLATFCYFSLDSVSVTFSNYLTGDGELEMEIETRFPMFGGWQTQFYIGYSIPTGKRYCTYVCVDAIVREGLIEGEMT